MFVDALRSHPAISHVVHEFKGSEDEYWEHPYVLSNTLEDWMLDDRITLVHLYREDAIAGAMSLLLMCYRFPQRAFNLPANEVLELARWRKDADKRLAKPAAVSVSYESLCRGKQIDRLPQNFADTFCDLIEIDRRQLATSVQKTEKLIPKNENELSWLNV